MSNKKDLQKALDALEKAKQEDIKAVRKLTEKLQQAHQEQTEQSNRHY